MPDHEDLDDAFEVTKDGVTVRKTLEADEFPVPTIKFEIDSERDEDVRLTLREHIPDIFSMDAIGFHPEYESENWTAFQDQRIEYERTIEPGESVVTIYGVRSDDDQKLEGFLREPEIVSIEIESAVEDTPEEDELGDVVDRESSDALRDIVLDDEADAPEPTDAVDDEPTGPTLTAEGSIAARLADELREDTVADADRKAIREELGLDLSASTEAQLRHLQTRVEDLLAYADALEEFLDAGGLERVSEIESSFADIEQTVRSREEDIESLEDDVAGIRASVDELDEQFEYRDEAIGEIETSLEELHQLEDELEQLSSSVEEVAEVAESARESASGFGGDIADMRAELHELNTDFEQVREDVEELVQWRSQLGQLFGGTEE